MAGSIIELHTEVPADQESNVFGQFDAYAKKILNYNFATPSLYSHIITAFS